jgi:hypothetical protein
MKRGRLAFLEQISAIENQRIDICVGLAQMTYKTGSHLHGAPLQNPDLTVPILRATSKSVG